MKKVTDGVFSECHRSQQVERDQTASGQLEPDVPSAQTGETGSRKGWYVIEDSAGCCLRDDECGKQSHKIMSFRWCEAVVIIFYA